ncbi:MAG: type II toxin-antitoxin system HigB family toxin [Anaerolineales bacterium]|nr:MAG: type II toxin-antitoxin system HigB family toxin [Anaerolineales bacterium]
MRVVARSTLREYWVKHPAVAEALKAWYADVSHADWNSPADLRRNYATVSILRDARAVFNIKGNQYRIVVRINYVLKLVFIRFVGTHTEYDKIDAESI